MVSDRYNQRQCAGAKDWPIVQAYEAAHKVAEEPFANPSGIVPLDLRVLVLPDPVETKTAGGIILIEPEVEKKQFAQCKATLIAVGENAWEEASSRSSVFTRPKPGDRILIAKYGGILIKGADDVEYRIMNDDDVLARLEE